MVGNQGWDEVKGWDKEDGKVKLRGDPSHLSSMRKLTVVLVAAGTKLFKVLAER